MTRGSLSCVQTLEAMLESWDPGKPGRAACHEKCQWEEARIRKLIRENMGPWRIDFSDYRKNQEEGYSDGINM